MASPSLTSRPGRHRLSPSIFLLAGLLAASVSSADDPGDELAALGWHADPQPAPACELLQPKLDANRAAWLSVHDPAGLPLPGFRCPGGEVTLPIATDSSSLQRREPGSPEIIWNIRATGRARGASASLDVDFPPFASPRSTGAPTLPSSPYGKPLAMPPQPVRDPALSGRASKYNRVPEPPVAPSPAILLIEPLAEGLRDDALVATADGKRWVTVGLGGDQPRFHFALDAGRVFGGEGRLLVAPRALQLDADTQLFAVDPASRTVTSLGRPAPPEAGRWLRITDVREAGGVIEALVAVDQIGKEGLSSPYGLLARREGSTWSFPERYFTPSPSGIYPELRFDPADPAKLWLVTGERRASRPLRSTAIAPPAP